MGRQQQAKRERHAGKNHKHQAAPPRAQVWLGWLIGSVVVFGVLIAALVIYIQANQAHFIKISVATSVQKIQTDLSRGRAAFTLDESTRLRSILTKIERLATERALDRQVGGHLMFVLQVAKEIVSSGEVKPGELEKMEMLLQQAQRRLDAISQPRGQPGP